MNRLRLIASIIFISVMTMMWLSLKDKREQATANQSSQQEKAEYVAHDLTRTVFDQDGRKIQTLSAKKMTYYESKSRAEFDSPLLVLESKSNKGKWRVSAQDGELYANDRLLLKQNVIAVNLTEKDYIDRIVSEYFRINLKDSTMQTEQQVQLFGEGIEIIGNGLFADLNQEKIDLIKHAKTIYHPNKQ